MHKHTHTYFFIYFELIEEKYTFLNIWSHAFVYSVSTYDIYIVHIYMCNNFFFFSFFIVKNLWQIIIDDQNCISFLLLLKILCKNAFQCL